VLFWASAFPEMKEIRKNKRSFFNVIKFLFLSAILNYFQVICQREVLRTHLPYLKVDVLLAMS
jgi:hypothetical protein